MLKRKRYFLAIDIKTKNYNPCKIQVFTRRSRNNHLVFKVLILPSLYEELQAILKAKERGFLVNKYNFRIGIFFEFVENVGENRP